MKKQNGITLIALIITIIVMIILVAVTVNVALNGGIFVKTNKAAYQTEASAIKEQANIERAIQIANNGGTEPKSYSISINDLDIPASSKTKFGNKLFVDSNGILYYDPTVVTNTEEQSWLEQIGIQGKTKSNMEVPVKFKAGNLGTIKFNKNFEGYKGEIPIAQLISEYEANGKSSGLDLEGSSGYLDVSIYTIDESDYAIFASCGADKDDEQFFFYISSDIEGIITFDGDNYTNLKAGWSKINFENTDSNGNYVLNELPDDYEFPTFSNLSISYSENDEPTDAELEFYNTVYNGLLIVVE